MGIRLIFLNLLGDDEEIPLFNLMGLKEQRYFLQEIAPAYRPYPKPTLVDR